MTRLKLELDQDTSLRLIRASVKNARPINLEAESIIRRHLALPEHERLALSAAYDLLRAVAAKAKAGGESDE
jgi:hypothetical protein